MVMEVSTYFSGLWPILKYFLPAMWDRDPNSFFFMWISSCPITTCWKDYSFPILLSWYPSWKWQPWLWMWGYISRFSGLSLWSLCLSLCHYHTLDYCSFVVTFEIRKCVLWFCSPSGLLCQFGGLLTQMNLGSVRKFLGVDSFLP